MRASEVLLRSVVHLNVVLPHVAFKLSWDLPENFLGKALSLTEGHELDDVTVDLAALVVFETPRAVTVQLSHAGEVCLADADNDNAACHRAQVNDRALRLFHVVDHAVGDQEQDWVGWRSLRLLNNVLEPLKDRVEKGGTGQLNLRNRVLVDFQNPGDSLHFTVL